jgi:hypothetical protein
MIVLLHKGTTNNLSTRGRTSFLLCHSDLREREGQREICCRSYETEERTRETATDGEREREKRRNRTNFSFSLALVQFSSVQFGSAQEARRLILWASSFLNYWVFLVHFLIRNLQK